MKHEPSRYNESTRDATIARGEESHERLSHLLPREKANFASSLLEAGLRSAVQIASMPRPVFLGKWEAIFPGERELGEVVYQNAVARKAFVALHYVRRVQSREPHYRAARFQ